MKRVKIFQGYTHNLESEINDFLDDGNVIESISQTNYERDILIVTIIYTTPKQ